MQYIPPYILEDKMDGLTLLLVSKLDQGKRINNLYTRGNGYKGKDVSHLINYMEWPQWIKMGEINKNIPEILRQDIAIRGEIVMTKEKFEKFGKGYKNSRNLVSGIINSKKNFNPILARELSFYAYHIMSVNMKPSEEITALQMLEFNTPNPVWANELTKEILENYLKERKKNAPYDMDGLVIYQDVVMEYPVGEAPRHVISFKSEEMNERAVTTVKMVTWEASKDRLLKPVVHYEPVTLSGAVLQKASGYNARYIVNNNIGPGAKILIIRSGDVIPKIINILTPAPNGPDYPKNRHYGWNENQVEFVLYEDDDEVITNKLKHFFDTLDIKNAGMSRVRSLVNAGIKNIDQLLRITPQQFASIDGIGGVLSNQFYNDIHDKITNISIPKIMDASGMFPHIGERRFDAIFDVYPNLLQLANENPQNIAMYIREVRGFNTLADEIAIRLKSFTDWLEHNPMITLKSPITLNTSQNSTLVPQQIIRTGNLSGMTIVFSGFRDKTAQQLYPDKFKTRSITEQIREHGGKVTTSVSRNTNYLILLDINDRKGKAQEAMDKGVPLISLADFINQYL